MEDTIYVLTEPGNGKAGIGFGRLCKDNRNGKKYLDGIFFVDPLNEEDQRLLEKFSLDVKTDDVFEFRPGWAGFLGHGYLPDHEECLVPVTRKYEDKHRKTIEKYSHLTPVKMELRWDPEKNEWDPEKNEWDANPMQE